MKSKTYVVTFFASVLAMAAVLPFVGNALPAPHGSYVSMEFAREEVVRQNAMVETPKPCVAFVGDSRTAFNISGRIVDRLLPQGCRSQNYGYAGLDLPQIKDLLAELPPIDTVVISVSETLLNRDKPDLVRTILSYKVPRFVFLGHQRLMHLYRSSNGTQEPAPYADWIWDSREKRWRYSSLEKKRVLDIDDYYEHTAKPTADNYFAVPGDASELQSLLVWLSKRAKRTIVIIPPSEGMFRKVARFDQPVFWQITEAAALKAGLEVVDCSQSCVGQSGFADSVHLNEEGVAAYSTSLSRLIAGQLSGLPPGNFN